MFDENGMEFRLAKGLPAKIWCSCDGKHILRENETRGFRELKQYDHGHGYLYIHIYDRNYQLNLLAHRAIALAFGIISDYCDKVDIDHINNIRNDNRVENLQALTHTENIKKRDTNGNANNKRVIYYYDGKLWSFISKTAAAKFFIEEHIAGSDDIYFVKSYLSKKKENHTYYGFYELSGNLKQRAIEAFNKISTNTDVIVVYEKKEGCLGN